MPKKNKLKTISKEKWDKAKKDIHEMLNNPNERSDGTFIYLDDTDIRNLKRKGKSDYDDIVIVYVKKKKKV